MDPPADHGESSYVETGKLLGQVAIVTGADSGIGRYLPEEESDALAPSVVIHEAGQKALRLPGDIGSPDYAKSLVSAAIKEFGHLDIVVNYAGFQMTHNIDEIPLEEFEHTFRTNVFGTFYLTQAALPKQLVDSKTSLMSRIAQISCLRRSAGSRLPNVLY